MTPPPHHTSLSLGLRTQVWSEWQASAELAAFLPSAEALLLHPVSYFLFLEALSLLMHIESKASVSSWGVRAWALGVIPSAMLRFQLCLCL